ncbi:hypothetical protein DEAC_c42390 [Desulfosporosinus acididurans]|uniref:Uncharacterized protein n=1 Tax=Desulfosporosinus acididurans TaxID=476652 RepID=A0A0J1FLK9_9FIRM|nr:hypothetical protein [Desulfosporosinus acididurans]KLU63823.1 hypothetical protein DEAC_c42390 [Desulfosporosinus acididurans]
MPKRREDHEYLSTRIMQMSENHTLLEMARILSDETKGNISKSIIARHMTLLRKEGKIQYKDRPWTDAEDEILKNLNEQRTGISAIAEKLNRSIASIQSRICQNNLANRMISEEQSKAVINLLLTTDLSLTEISIITGTPFNAVRHIWKGIKPQTAQIKRPNPSRKNSTSVAEQYIRKQLEEIFRNQVVPKKNNRDWSGGRYEIDIPIKTPYGKFAIEVNSKLHADRKMIDRYKRRLAEKDHWIWIPLWFWDTPNKANLDSAVETVLNIIQERREEGSDYYNCFIQEVTELEKRYYNPHELLYDLKVNVKFGPSWADKDNETLILNYGLISLSELSKLLSIPRSNDAMKHKAKQLGLVKKRKIFNPAEDEIIANYYQTLPKENIIQMLQGWSWPSIISRAHVLGIRRKNLWSPEENALLQSKYSNESLKSITESLPNHSWLSIVSQASRLKIKKDQLIEAEKHSIPNIDKD